MTNQPSEVNLKFDNPSQFFKALEPYWLGDYQVDAMVDTIKKVYTIKAIPIKR